MTDMIPQLSPSSCPLPFSSAGEAGMQSSCRSPDLDCSLPRAETHDMESPHAKFHSTSTAVAEEKKKEKHLAGLLATITYTAASCTLMLGHRAVESILKPHAVQSHLVKIMS